MLELGSRKTVGEFSITVVTMTSPLSAELIKWNIPVADIDSGNKLGATRGK